MQQITLIEKPPIIKQVFDNPSTGDKEIRYSFRSPFSGENCRYSLRITYELLVFNQWKRIKMMEEDALRSIEMARDFGWIADDKGAGYCSCIHCGCSRKITSKGHRPFYPRKEPCDCLYQGVTSRHAQYLQMAPPSAN